MAAIQGGRYNPAMFRIAVAILLLAGPAQAKDRGFSSYDGDTTRATFRIANIDAPELGGKCAAEKHLAIKARDFTRAWLSRGNVVIRQTGIDRYGRVLATIEQTAMTWARRGGISQTLRPK